MIDHPLYILQFAENAILTDESCVVGLITDTKGGSLRSTGSLIAISKDGTMAGHVSNGCLDSDLKLQAQDLLATQINTAQTKSAQTKPAQIKPGQIKPGQIKTGQTKTNTRSKTLTYGHGSPYIDIRLPCGGSVTLILYCVTNSAHLTNAIQALKNRQSLHIHYTETDLTFSSTAGPSSIQINPILQLHILGTGPEAQALYRIGKAAGYACKLYAVDNYKAMASLKDSDRHTAIIMLLHEHDKELPFLQHALLSDAFYIGAMGSRKTHQTRIETLVQSGATQAEINRLRGPIGLLHGLRNADMIAISCLAEIIDQFQT